MDGSIQLDPKVKVSDLDMSLLPLQNFHIVVVVEPDPETWMMPPGDREKVLETFKLYSDLLRDDVIGEYDSDIVTVPFAEDVKETLLIVVCEVLDIYYFLDITAYSPFIIQNSGEAFEKLCMLLDGVAKNHPTWNRVAIVGGVYGDEIFRAANAVQALGFETTIVTRHCITEYHFLNIDDLSDFLNAERKKRGSGLDL